MKHRLVFLKFPLPLTLTIIPQKGCAGRRVFQLISKILIFSVGQFVGDDGGRHEERNENSQVQSLGSGSGRIWPFFGRIRI